jgi:predicted enzyme related to lactoylglutathione lyase
MPAVDGIWVVTEDVARSLAFYRLLGLELPSANLGSYVATVFDGQRLSWGAPGGPQTLPRTGLRLLMRCASPAQVDALARKIRRAGYRVATGPADAPWGARLCSVLDPDGNVVDVFAPLP